MARLPFNPDRVPVPPEAVPGKSAASPAAGDRPLTVSQVSALVKNVLADHVPAKLRVVGEVSNFSDRTHWFFSLKDDGATLKCVCFGSAARKVNFPVRDGMEIVATGRLDYYDAQGSLQLYVDALEPVGQGALELRYRALCDELRKLGYFDDDRKKPLPPMPCKVAVVTSRSGAALQDVIKTAGKRWHGCELVLVDVRVQGAAAAPEIAAAIDALSRHGQTLGIEAILLTRGGGSIEDLWAFNERLVADAIFRCPLPIVAAIGHETDTTIAELVADLRCSTPTQAAMQLIPDRQALEQQVQQIQQRLTLVTRRHVQQERHRLEALARHPMFRRPQAIYQPLRDRVDRLDAALRTLVPRIVQRQRGHVEAIARHPLLRRPMSLLESPRRRLDHADAALRAAAERRLRERRKQFESLARQLESVSPTNVLKRGYSYTLDPAGRVVRLSSQVNVGDTITTVLSGGRLASRVESTDGAPPAAPPPPAPPSPAQTTPPPTPAVPPRKRRRGSPHDDEPSLFE